LVLWRTKRNQLFLIDKLIGTACAERLVRFCAPSFSEKLMKKFVHALVLTGLVGVPALAMAAEPASPHTLTGNITLTSDYVFRGVSQTQGGPAIQGGFDYAHASGFYVGTWASNVAWVKEGGFKDDSSMEIDLYGGYKGSMGPIGYDLGAITYYYPGDKNTVNDYANPNTTEVYVAGSWEFLTLKYSHVVSSHFIGWEGPDGEKTRNSNYLELNAAYDLGNGWGIQGHVGHQKVKNLSIADYTDWKIGVSKDIGFGVVSLAYTDTNADEVCCYTIAGEKVADGRAFVSFSKSF
jgi:uncharacterized protein (TIGR02001 family)